MIFALVSGPLVADPKTGTTSKGNPFCRATVRSGEGDGAIFVSVLTFSEDDIAALAAARKGDGVSASGRLEFGTWARDGEERPSYTLMGERILTAAPPRRAPRRADYSPTRREQAGTNFPPEAGDLDAVRPLRGRAA